MAKLIQLVLILTLGFAGCNKPLSKVETDPVTGYKTILTVKDDSIFHGPYTKSDSTGTLLERGHYHNGELHGIREILYPDGKVKVRERYSHGQIADLYEYYHPNGRHELKGYYIDGAMYGPWNKYDDEGNLVETVTMINNEEMGPFTEYYGNGKIQAEGMYLHGPNEDGQLKLFDESGELYKIMLCDSGTCITTWQKE